MSSERLDQVKSLIDRALDLPQDQREGFLRRACDGDEDLRLEVESLLDQEGAGRLWPEAPIVPSLKEPVNGQAPKLEPDERIGPYRVLGPLGEGGMGEVVLAVREDEFSQRVALKVVHPKYVSRELLHRFHEERQILAELEHPNIARILDGGTTAGDRPYFAMEYIEGSPIDAYCDRHGLDVRQRLELFVDVCRAIHLAHTNLVVHRDLKPSNILVTPGGAPKVIDFGIAKRIRPEGLDAGPALTGLGRKPMTLRYAAPEQVEGRQITTATDVYALGVLLYELLTRRSPYDSRTDLELADAIRGTDPERPSTATQAEGDLEELYLDRDLDAIVLKAMRKEPDARYGSAEQLAEDLQRYLDREPVQARRGTWTYRTGKFVRRRWLGISAAAALFLLAVSAPIHRATLNGPD
ncbi:MAG: serine/threonine-protein kinase [Acidobacteriota bacterium]